VSGLLLSLITHHEMEFILRMTNQLAHFPVWREGGRLTVVTSILLWMLDVQRITQQTEGGTVLFASTCLMML
jgi:hypothetical protein